MRHQGRRGLARDFATQNTPHRHFGAPPMDIAGFLVDLPKGPDGGEQERRTASGVMLLPRAMGAAPIAEIDSGRFAAWLSMIAVVGLA
jgi:hypothetical protein